MYFSRKAFTLIELLIVIAIVAILAAVVILILNPIEFYRQARDSSRYTSLLSLNSGIAIYRTDVVSGYLGSSSVVYVSIPSALSNCSDLGLPLLPASWTYACASSSTYKNVNGSGWMPIDFTRSSVGVPLSTLPVDPSNSTSSRNYYTYVTDGTSWQLAAPLEASKNKLGGSGDSVSKDAGSSPTLQEFGTNLFLNPLDYGDSSLIGYWNFQEGSGGVVYDHSGINQTGTWNGLGAHYTMGQIGSYAGSFNGTNDYVNIPNSSNINFNGRSEITIAAWIKTSDLTGRFVFSKPKSAFSAFAFLDGGSGKIRFRIGQPAGGIIDLDSTASIADNGWHYIVGTYDNSSAKKMTLYIDCQLNNQRDSASDIIDDNVNSLRIGFHWTTEYFSGSIDDVRIYNKALSAAQVGGLCSSSGAR